MSGHTCLANHLRLVVSAVAVVALVDASPVLAQTRNFNVPAGPASSSIPKLARQAGIQILASAVTVRAKRTNAVRGRYSVEKALRLLLDGTNLAASSSGTGIYIINTVRADTAEKPARRATAVPANQSFPRPGKRKLEEIVVTARFISEDVQDTPMAVTSKTSLQIASANIVSTGSLGAVVPNLWTVPGDARSAGTPKITLRGVTQGDSSSYAAPPAVAIYTDDVYHATTAGSDLLLTDIDHIEINRGPQSTLSGNASIGGSIKIYTKDPLGDNSGYAAVTAGSRNKLGVSGALDMALSPTLAMRVSGSFERQTGWVDQLDFTCQMQKLGRPETAGSLPFAQPDSARRDCLLGTLGGVNHQVGQVKLRWRPADNFDFILNVRKRIERDEETPEIVLAFKPNPDPNPNEVVQIINEAVEETFGLRLDDRFLPPPDRPLATYATFCRPNLPLNGSLPRVDGVFTPSNYCYGSEKTASHTLISGKLHYGISDNTQLTAIGAYTAYQNAFSTAGDHSPLGYQLSHFENRAHQVSGELRFDGKTFEDRLNWVAGGFVVRVTGFQDSVTSVASNSGFAFDEAKIESQSAFFHLDFRVNPQWRISGGARYTDGQIIYHFDHPPFFTIDQPFASQQKRLDWLLSTDYKITDDILIYASAASGSRPPGVVTIINSAQQFLDTPSEELISYETGIKADLLGHSLRTNIAAYYTDYKSLGTQVRGFQCLGELPQATWFSQAIACNQFTNKSFVGWNLPVGHPATIKGFEWEITAFPINGLRVDWMGGYNNYKSGVRIPGEPGYFWPGNHRQPNWNMHANASYEFETPIGSFTPQIDWSWQSQQDFDTTSAVRPPLPVFIVPPYSLWNAQIHFASPDGNWSARLTANNVTNKFYSFQKLSGTLTAQTRVGPPREISLTLRRTF